MISELSMSPFAYLAEIADGGFPTQSPYIRPHTKFARANLVWGGVIAHVSEDKSAENEDRIVDTNEMAEYQKYRKISTDRIRDASKSFRAFSLCYGGLLGATRLRNLYNLATF